MDIHRKVEGLTPEAVTAAHQRDLAVQARYGVRFRRYWYDEKTGKVFCLSEAPNAEATAAVHREAHGLLADEIIEVAEGACWAWSLRTRVTRRGPRNCSRTASPSSGHTAENHVHRVLNRLGLRSRAQVAAWAVRHGLADEAAPPHP